MSHTSGRVDRPFGRILTATDGSERATESVRQGATLAAAFGAELILVHVIDGGRSHDAGAETAAEGTLEAASAVARALDVEPDRRILAGEPGAVLIELAEVDDVDLLCVGPDAGLLAGAVRIGRIASHVIREAPCSVLVARGAGRDFPYRIGCAVDGSEGSVETARTAAALAAATGAELRLVHVVPVFRGHNTEWTLGPEDASPPELEPSVAAASSLGVTPIRQMAMGRPERTLVAAAERESIDLMVVGHRGIHGVRRMLGSVSERVAHHAPCSVMVVRNAAASG